jgi:DNA repair protein RecO (recombination protein O)
LEEKDRGLANFHLAFMFNLAQFLGIAPNLDDYNKDSLFDLMNGEYTFEKRTHNHYLNLQQSNFLNVFKKINFNNMHLYKLSQGDRNVLINFMLDYYRMHVYDFTEIKSLEVLRELY